MGDSYQTPVTAPLENTTDVALGSEELLKQLPTELPLPAVQPPQLTSETIMPQGLYPESSTQAPTGPETDTV